MSIDFSTLKGLTIPEGNVTQIADASGNVIWKKAPKEYLTFSAANPITLSAFFSTGILDGWDGIMYYSFNAKEWAEWDGSEISSNTIYLCGKNNTKMGTRLVISPTTEKVSCTGEIESLLDYSTVELGGHPIMAEKCFYMLFSNMSGLTTAPSLSATTLTPECYSNMFARTALTTPPKLPATVMAEKCYDGMFKYCKSLTTVPSLPATTLAPSCYEFMFDSCTSLTAVPALRATTLADWCYFCMFSGCTSIQILSVSLGDYSIPYRVPISGDVTNEAVSPVYSMFDSSFEINRTYYLHSSNSIVY